MITSSRQWVGSCCIVLVDRRTSSALEVRTLGRKCKVRVKQLAVFAGSLLINCFPKKGKAVELKKPQLGSQFITGVCNTCGFKKLLKLELQELQLHSPNRKSTFHADGRTCASTSWRNHCSFQPSIFIIARRMYPSTPWPCHRGHDSRHFALSLIRPATCSSHWLFTGITFV